MTIEGDYTSFAHLETPMLGTLARRTLITTNVVHVLEAANGKPIIFMPARHDHHRVQTGDGYAAYVAGQIVGAEIGVTTDEQASWWGGRGIGTVPHALIASYGGDTVLAAQKFAEWAPPDMNVTVLVDFENDSVRTALEVADALGDRLWGVRLDTSESLVDRSLVGRDGRLQADRRERAARLEGARRARRGRPRARAHRRLRRLHRRQDPRASRSEGVPVDAYGVGSSLIRGSNDFTGDIVMTDGKPSAKVGRHYRENPRLERSHDRCDNGVMAAHPLGRRHAGRLHGAVGEALRPGARGDRAGARAARRRRRARPASTHVASADDHELTDPEISDAPDFRNTYPPHCLRGTRGAEKILETKQRDPLPLSRSFRSRPASCRG